MGSDIRIKSALKVRIGEAKSLPSKSCRILPGCPNTYCIINLDKEELFETEVVYGTPCPFFCEKFDFEIPRAFLTVGFYLIATDTTFGVRKDTTIGKVTFTKDQLINLPNKDQWHPLRCVKLDSEAQGKAHISLCTERLGKSSFLKVMVKECVNLFMADRHKVQPFAVMEITGPNGSIRSKIQQTKPLRRSTDMQWKNQIYTFKLNDVLKKCDLTTLTLKLDFHHSNGMFREGTFLGQVVIPLGQVDSTWTTSWYFLCPKQTDSITLPNHDLGSLRLFVEYKEDHILPSNDYTPLLNLLTRCLDRTQDIETSPIVLIATIFDEPLQLVNLAQSLVRIFLHISKVEELLLSLTEFDMTGTSNPNTLFRANSLATKGIDELMKMVGMPYLQSVLKPTLDTIHRENLTCEIDPARLPSKASLESNLQHLSRNIEAVYSNIVSSGARCPYILSSLFDKLQKQAIDKFPDVSEIRYTAVSGFIFLRLFAPAILNPKLFKLQSRRPNLTTTRTLTLVSKVIQSLGNLDTHQAGKEQYMEAISQRVLNTQHVNGVKQFLEDICDTDSKNNNLDNTRLQKEGYLLEYKVGSMPGRCFTKRRKLYKLSDEGISCSKSSQESGIVFLRRDDVLWVSRVDENAFGVPHILQIIHTQGTTYLRANNSVDYYDWLSGISKLKNPARSLERYHTGVYLHTKWTCCTEKQPENGCQPTTVQNEHDLYIDVYRELERVYQIVVNGLDKLKKLKEDFESQCVNNATTDRDKKQSRNSLKSINDVITVIEELQRTHKQYKEEELDISPGSRALPLGPSG